MPETLLTNSSIKLYGRVMDDLRYRDCSHEIGSNNFLQRQLAGPRVTLNASPVAHMPDVPVTTTGGLWSGMNVSSDIAGTFDSNTVIDSVDAVASSIRVSPAPLMNGAHIAIRATWRPRFARIYAFSFQGAVYTLPKPSIFIVHGRGIPIDTALRTNVEQSGVAAREWEFSGEGANRDLNYWEYEKGDFSLRLDTEAGPFEEILLAAALRAGADMADRSGASLGIRSGASLAGASLSGASLSGASVSGASLSGASLRTNR
jgi:hypothetical protein